MEQVKSFLSQLISISDNEFNEFISYAHIKRCKRNEILSTSGVVPNQLFFILKGTIRQYIIDNKGNEQTIHFAFENEVVGDYVNMSRKLPAKTVFQAIEESDIVVFPFTAIELAIRSMAEGEKLGRLMSDNTFFYLENRLLDTYIRSPKERYDNITTIFPNIHNRVPQHMIASYLGITSVHLSRLKNPK